MPIQKIIARKDRNFKQLLEYVHREVDEDHPYPTYLHNIYLNDPTSVAGMTKAFVQNSQYMKKRSNGVGQYHEIISFHPEDSNFLKEHPEVVEDFARVYLEIRAPNSLGVAVPHFDADHTHIHFVISANEIGSSKATRLSKQDLKEVKGVLAALQDRYPEIHHSYTQGRFRTVVLDPSKPLPRSEGKEYLRGQISSILDDDMHDPIDILRDHGLAVSMRNGKPQSVIFQNKRYRLTSLFKEDSPELKKLLEHEQQEFSDELEEGLDLELELEN